jgi:hypothetical protein
MNLEDVNYFYPQQEIEDWQRLGTPLSQELLDDDLCFVKLSDDGIRLICSKQNAFANIFYIVLIYNSNYSDVKALNPGEVYEASDSVVNLSFYNNDGNIILKFGCLFVTFTNIEYVLSVLNER